MAVSPGPVNGRREDHAEIADWRVGAEEVGPEARDGREEHVPDQTGQVVAAFAFIGHLEFAGRVGEVEDDAFGFGPDFAGGGGILDEDFVELRNLGVLATQACFGLRPDTTHGVFSNLHRRMVVALVAHI